jgi:hypothetical protein
MKKLLCFLLISVYLQLISMKQVDLFSQLPNKCRKLIILPFIDEISISPKPELAYMLPKVKKILMSFALVSKKSYEQVSCIFFTRDIIELLSKKANVPRGNVALSLKTKGMRNYYDLSHQIYMTLLDNKKPAEEKWMIKTLVSQGADVNYQTVSFGTTPLMKATEYAKKDMVYLLVAYGADVNAKNEKGYVREHSIVCKEQSLLSHLYDLAKLMENCESRCVFYGNPIATYVRNALQIDCDLAELGGKAHINPYAYILLPQIEKNPIIKTVLDFIIDPCCQDCVYCT